MHLKEHHLECVRAAHLLLVKHSQVHITIKQLSEQVCLDRTMLQAGFKLLYQTSIYDFLIQYRMKQARELLHTTDKEIKMISAQCGYKNHSSFSKAFRQSNGQSPKAFRRSKRKK